MQRERPHDVVSLAELETDDALRARFGHLPTTKGGLPKGMLWVPHDTGRMGYAAARRCRQMERDERKHFDPNV